jgi:hypothetical protein
MIEMMRRGKRPHVPVGTEICIPPNKLKWDEGNPTAREGKMPLV